MQGLFGYEDGLGAGQEISEQHSEVKGIWNIKPYWKQVFERHESDILIFIGLLIFVWTSGIGIYLHSRLQHQRCIEALKDAKDGIIIMSLCQ